MEGRNEVLASVQDQKSLMGALLVIEEALETGVWPKSFLLYNDEWITHIMCGIARIAKEKYGIKVPDSELP